MCHGLLHFSSGVAIHHKSCQRNRFLQVNANKHNIVTKGLELFLVSTDDHLTSCLTLFTIHFALTSYRSGLVSELGALREWHAVTSSLTSITNPMLEEVASKGLLLLLMDIVSRALR